MIDIRIIFDKGNLRHHKIRSSTPMRTRGDRPSLKSYVLTKCDFVDIIMVKFGFSTVSPEILRGDRTGVCRRKKKVPLSNRVKELRCSSPLTVLRRLKLVLFSRYNDRIWGKKGMNGEARSHVSRALLKNCGGNFLLKSYRVSNEEYYDIIMVKFDFPTLSPEKEGIEGVFRGKSKVSLSLTLLNNCGGHPR